MALDIASAITAGSGAGGGLGSIVSGIAALAGAGGKGGGKRFKEATKVWLDVQRPDYNFDELDAPKLALLAEFYPETYEAKIPDEVKQIHDSPELRQKVVQGIENLEVLAEEGLGTAEKIATENIQGDIQREVESARKSAIRNLAETGRLSAGTELAAGLAAGQQGAQLARGMGQDLTRQAIENRLAATQGVISAAGNLRAQDIGLSEKQADIINRFNQWTSEAQTQAAKDAAAIRNAGELRNIEEEQRIAEQNELNKYEVAKQNLDRENRLKEALGQFDIQLAAGKSGSLETLGTREDLEKAAKLQQIGGIGSGVGSILGAVAGGAAGGAF